MTNAIYDVAEGQVGELDNPLFIEVGCVDTARGLVSDLDEGRKKLDNFRDALGELQKRWDNQFIPEDGGFPEKYLQRRFIIVLDGYVFDPRANRNNRFLLRIEPDALGGEKGFSGLISDNQLSGKDSRRSYDELVMFVSPVKQMKGIQVVPVPVLARLDFVDDQPLRAGEGLLYRAESGYVRYRSFLAL